MVTKNLKYFESKYDAKLNFCLIILIFYMIYYYKQISFEQKYNKFKIFENYKYVPMITVYKIYDDNN